jgi:phenylacetate-CoA ligase
MIEEDRLRELDGILTQNRPLNSKGEQVTGLDDLNSSPTLTKKQLRAQTLKDMGRSGVANFGRHTAGTTGEPTYVFLNRQELARMLGVRDYCFRHYGLRLGQREARLWGRPESGFKTRVRNFAMNRRVFYTADSQAKTEVADLVKWQPDYLYGYSSLLLEAAKILDNMKLSFKPPKCVVCTAESIRPAQKAFISRVFRAPVAEEYGSTEFDVIAFECRQGHRHLVSPWLMFEKDQESELISDVSRVSQNIIRYGLGDSFLIKGSHCRILGDLRFIEELKGRTIDSLFFINNSERIHEIVFSRLFDRYFYEYNDVFSFQMEQSEFSALEVLIDKPPVVGLNHLRSFLAREIVKEVGTKVEITVRVGDLSKTGEKRNYFIQKMKVPE